MDLTDPVLRQGPASDVIEVSVFGPGVGECIVLHLGSGAWVIVDSCLHEAEPVALRYLSALGVQTSSVVGIVATHWHDDHHAGMAKVVAACDAAKFYCSAALRCDEFLTLATTARESYDKSSGIDEMHAVLSELSSRHTAGKSQRNVGPKWLSEGTRFLLHAPPAQPGFSTELWALSPSSASITKSKQAIAGLIPEIKSSRGRFPEVRPNHTCLAIQLKHGNRSALLASDLEEIRGDPQVGWSGVIQNHANVSGRSQIYKVAHHGSKNGHHDGIYDNLLDPGAHAILTPFRRSKLPEDTDIARIQARTTSVHLTASAHGRRPSSRGQVVDKTLRDVAKSRRTEAATMGLVRARFGSSPEVQIEHFGSAQAL